MRKIAILFVVAVLAPSLALAWLAVRSLGTQELVLERQQALLCQEVTERLARACFEQFEAIQTDFSHQVETSRPSGDQPLELEGFDARLREIWPLAEVGFVVTLDGQILAPSAKSGSSAWKFREDNDAFLGNRASAEVYVNAPKQWAGGPGNVQTFTVDEGQQKPGAQQSAALPQAYNVKTAEQRRVSPQNQAQHQEFPGKTNPDSQLAPVETAFRQVLGERRDGSVARFLDDRLNILLWHRPVGEERLVYGARLDLGRLTEALRTVIRLDPPLSREIGVALLNDSGRPVARSQAGFEAEWKRPFVSSEVGEWLPHWEVAAYRLDPKRLSQTARTLRWLLGLLTALLLLAIGVGGWLIVADLRRQLTLARQKTDFVSNVSHELKTPLTSIRMFAEMLAEGRVRDPERQQAYLNVITGETARLTRLINNVLDFARLERGEKRYRAEELDLVALAEEAFEVHRPRLEAEGFRMEFAALEPTLPVWADRDALAQILVNLLSNSEKYGGQRKEIRVEARRGPDLPARAEVRVLDRGLGVPPGSEARIFEQFHRAHDALHSGIQGTGLGLTLARQLARAQGGDVRFERREGEGSCFTLEVPLRAAMDIPKETTEA